MKAYAIKNPKGVIQFSSIRTEEIICITDFEDLVQTYRRDEFWIDLEKEGYRCVPVEITEIKKQGQN